MSKSQHFTLHLHVFTDFSEEQLLYGQSLDLSKTDLVSFAKTVTKAPIKNVPEEFSDFKSVKIYIRPAAGMIGDIPSPRGFSRPLSAANKLMLPAVRSTLDIICFLYTDFLTGIDGRQIFIAGPVKKFDLGPLKLEGVEKPDAILHTEISSTIQHTELVGRSKIYDSGCTIFAGINPAESTKFKFYTYVTSFSIHLLWINFCLGACPSPKTFNSNYMATISEPSH